MKAQFDIATDRGRRTVSGYKASDESLLGIHRFADGDPWTVTFLPTGTTANSVFPERGSVIFSIPEIMVRSVDAVENRALAAWLALSALPWGTTKAPEWAERCFKSIRDAADL